MIGWYYKLSILMTGVRLTKRGLLATTILHFAFFTWYVVFSADVLRHAIGPSEETYLMVRTSFNFIIAIALLTSSLFIHTLDRRRIIYGSSIVTSIASILLIFPSGIVIRITIILAAGISFATGQLAFFTYFWALTLSEERGRAAGLVGFISLPIFHIASLMAETFDFSGAVMFGTILSLGLLVIKLGPKEKAILTAKNHEKEYDPEKRTVLLYSVPWALFTLVNATLSTNISYHVLQNIPFSYYMFLALLQLVAAGFGALGGGVVADFFGRRLSLVFSLTLYGIASALAGLVKKFEMFCFVYIANGLNWGILMTLYILVVWGDLANKESCAKRYSIGLICFYLAMSVGSLFMHQISQIPLMTSALVSCLLIFLSNISLIFAPELAPSDFRERIKMKLYIYVVKKIKRKS